MQQGVCVPAYVYVFIRFGFASVFRGNDCSKSAAQKKKVLPQKNPPLLNYPFTASGRCVQASLYICFGQTVKDASFNT